eukprot:TRINITY_DN3136_c0_g1_i3.p1 TRINITY_DN3136_c0_g1~~TRINITY_DN3136_c0_g1_i3.p1  ORF type:complete len:174 (-),score=23.85 TRINITY_DN3136_c0_g1_i3:106-627(-)
MSSVAIDVPGEARFVADACCGGLANKMRVMGFDVEWNPHLSQGEAVRQAQHDERVFLTTDTKFPAASKKFFFDIDYVLLGSNNPFEQLFEVMELFHLQYEERRVFTRCTKCNGVIHTVTKEEVVDQVHPELYKVKDHFFRCDRCRKVYWEGRVHGLFIGQLKAKAAESEFPIQ